MLTIAISFCSSGFSRERKKSPYSTVHLMKINKHLVKSYSAKIFIQIIFKGKIFIKENLPEFAFICKQTIILEWVSQFCRQGKQRCNK
jgi:hypothetical protein